MQIGCKTKLKITLVASNRPDFLTQGIVSKTEKNLSLQFKTIISDFKNFNPLVKDQIKNSPCDFIILNPCFQEIWLCQNTNIKKLANEIKSYFKKIIEFSYRYNPAYFLILLPEKSPDHYHCIWNKEKFYYLLNSIITNSIPKHIQEKGRICFLDVFKNASATNARFFNAINLQSSPQVLTKAGAIIGTFIQKNLFSKIKAVAFDLDNTIWAGELADLGPLGIKMSYLDESKLFIEVQKLLNECASRGIYLVILSKNNISDVKKTFKLNKSILINQENISYFGINWNDKATNLERAAKRLNILPESFYYIDDSALERQKMGRIIPSENIFPFPKNIDNYPSLLKSKLGLIIKNQTSIKRTINSIKILENKKFISNQKNVSFLQNKKHVFGKNITNQNIFRAVELIQKTNQFNLTKNRSSLTDCKKMISGNNNFCKIYSFQNRSEYLPQVGVVIYELKKNNLCEFLLSCRAFERGIESKMLYDLKKWLKAKKLTLNLKAKSSISELSDQFIKTHIHKN